MMINQYSLDVVGGSAEDSRPPSRNPCVVLPAKTGLHLLDVQAETKARRGDQRVHTSAYAAGQDDVPAESDPTSWSAPPCVRDLRLALATGEFALAYQPYICARTGVVAGCEALLRWHHRVLGPVSPTSFIPLAERTGEIVPIGAWVLEAACREAAAWPVDCRVSVNVSSVQLHAPGFASQVAAALRDSGLPAARLELELTEGVLIRDAQAAQACIEEIRALGVGVALDDFGTGYSSLSYLQHFTFDRVKIDRSFVQSLLAKRESEILVRGMCDIAARLGMAVTAEGVETEAEAALLRAIGPDELQGFLFSRPLDAEAVRLFLTGHAGEAVGPVQAPLPGSAPVAGAPPLGRLGAGAEGR